MLDPSPVVILPVGWMEGWTTIPVPASRKSPQSWAHRDSWCFWFYCWAQTRAMLEAPHTFKVLCDLGLATSLHQFLFVGWE